jgi:hypothetical protein
VTAFAAESGGAAYEVTVAGGVGPALRVALRPHHTAPTRCCTLLTTSPSVDLVDLVDLLLLLQSHGVEVRAIRST